MYEVGITSTFHASHSLKGDFGPATEVHAHDYRVDVMVRGAKLTSDGVLVDIVQLEHAVRGITDRWHDRCLDEIEELRGVNTTVEQVAEYLHSRISTALLSPELTIEVRVWERPDTWGAYVQAELRASPR